MNDSTPAQARWSTDTMRRTATGVDMRTAAARYAELGIPVFPCVPGGKQPLTPNGFHDATTSADVVAAWWRRTPQANIGLPAGAPSGVLVVDVDVHTGGSGFAAFERARSAHLADGWGWLVRTPSGGLHAYYPAMDSEQRSWQVPSAHIDLRGDGGYVIAPPSRVDVADRPTPYVVIAIAQHPPRPLDAGDLRNFLDPPRPVTPTQQLPPTRGSHPDKLAAWVATRPEGARNHSLFWAACRMAEDGHRYDTTLATLGDAARSAGLPDREAETTIRSAYRIASRLCPASRPGPTNAAEAVQL